MGNLSDQVRQIDIEDFFQGCGDFRVEMNQGHALIEFREPSSAQQAVASLNGRRLGGQNIFLNLLVENVAQLAQVSPVQAARPAMPSRAEWSSGAPVTAQVNGRSRSPTRPPKRHVGSGGWDPQPAQPQFGQQTFAPAGYGMPAMDGPREKQEIVRTKYGIKISNIGEDVFFKKLKLYGNSFGDCTFVRCKNGEALITYSNRTDMMKAYERIQRGDGQPPFHWSDDIVVEFEFPATCDVRWKGDIVNHDGKRRKEGETSGRRPFSKWGVRIRPTEGASIPEDAWPALKDFAKKFGDLTYTRIDSDGSALAAFPTEIEAEYAMNAMNDEEECTLGVDGVNGVFVEQELLDPPKKRERDSQENNKRAPGYCVTLRNIGSADWREVKDYGRQFGNLIFGRVNREGTGLAVYETQHEAEAAANAMNNEVKCSLPGATHVGAFYDARATEEEKDWCNKRNIGQDGKKIRGEFGLRIRDCGNNDWLALKKYGNSFGGIVRFTQIERDSTQGILMYATEEEANAAFNGMNGDTSRALLGVACVEAKRENIDPNKPARGGGRNHDGPKPPGWKPAPYEQRTEKDGKKIMGEYGIRIRNIGGNDWRGLKDYGRSWGAIVRFTRIDEDGSAILMYQKESEAIEAFQGMDQDTSGALRGVRVVEARRENADGSQPANPYAAAPKAEQYNSFTQQQNTGYTSFQQPAQPAFYGGAPASSQPW